MKRLLSANFYCLRKSKLSLILLLIALFLPLLTCLLYLGINFLLKEAGPDDPMLSQGLFNAKSVMSGSFSLTSNLGLILPIFTGIIIGADLTNGTLRNKIIVGNSKTKVFFSHLIVAVIFHLIIGFVYAASTAGFGLLFFKYGIEITGEEVRNLIYFYITGFGAFVFSATIVSSFALLFKTPAPTILISVFACLGFGLLASLIGIVDYSNYKYLVYLIPTFANTMFTSNGGIDTPVFIEGLLSFALFGGAFITVGALLFNKKEIK